MDFKPEYDGSQFFGVGMLPGERMAELGRAKAIVVSIDRREVLDLRSEGVHLNDAVAAFMSCAKGEAGPWSEPAWRSR